MTTNNPAPHRTGRLQPPHAAGRWALLAVCTMVSLISGCRSHHTPTSLKQSDTTSTAGGLSTPAGAAPTATPTTAAAESFGPEVAPVPDGVELAPASSTAPGEGVGGISCDQAEQVAYHIHAHLSVFVRGEQRQIPAGIGVLNPVNEAPSGDAFVAATRCYYWLHTHAADGIIHIESPTTNRYTLGDFFDVWRQPLGRNQFAGYHGPVTAFVNGLPFTGDPRTIPLDAHTTIQLDIGTPIVAYQNFDQWGQL